MIENLTKENFWNEMQEKYPKAMKKFCDWIDKYKEDNNWERIFNAGYDTGYTLDRNSKMTTTKSPKYHELPIALQYGIFCEFLYEWCIQEGCTVVMTSESVGKNLREETIESIEETFEVIEEELNE